MKIDVFHRTLLAISLIFLIVSIIFLLRIIYIRLKNFADDGKTGHSLAEREINDKSFDKIIYPLVTFILGFLFFAICFLDILIDVQFLFLKLLNKFYSCNPYNYIWFRLDSLMNLVGALMLAVSFGKNREEAYQEDSKGKKIYLASFSYPVLFKIGIMFLVVGFAIALFNK